jgi:ATP synthase I subunit
MKRPFTAIPLMTSGLSALAAASLVVAFHAAGLPDWSVGVIGGWLAGSLNGALLARRVSRLTAASTVAGFLYGMASRFALIAVVAIGVYRLLDASLLGFAIGLSLVTFMGVPVSLIWALRRESAA